MKLGSTFLLVLLVLAPLSLFGQNNTFSKVMNFRDTTPGFSLITGINKFNNRLLVTGLKATRDTSNTAYIYATADLQGKFLSKEKLRIKGHSIYPTYNTDPLSLEQGGFLQVGTIRGFNDKDSFNYAYPFLMKLDEHGEKNFFQNV